MANYLTSPASPYLDVKALGASGSPYTGLATTTAGSSTVTLNEPGDFQNGQYVYILQAGTLPSANPVPANPNALPSVQPQQWNGGSSVSNYVGGTTSYTYYVATINPGTGGLTQPAAFSTASGSTSCNLNTFNQIRWTTPNQNQYGYIIWGASTNPSGSQGLLGHVHRENYTDYGTSTRNSVFNSVYGQDFFSCPIPEFPLTGFPSNVPAGVVAGPLVGSYIVSGGGTTTLTLSQPAVTSATNATIFHDDSYVLAGLTANGQAKTLYFPSGTYYTQGALGATMENCLLEGDAGNTSLLVQLPQNQDTTFSFSNCVVNNLVFHGNAVNSPNPTYQVQVPVFYAYNSVFHNCSFVHANTAILTTYQSMFSRCFFSNLYGLEGVELGNGYSSSSIPNFIQNCQFVNAVYNALYISNSPCVIEGCNFNNIGGNGGDVPYGSGNAILADYGNSVLITGNLFNGSYQSAIVLGNPGSSLGEFVVTHNFITGVSNGGPALQAQNVYNGVISHNNIYNNGVGGMSVGLNWTASASNNINVTHNHIYNNSGQGLTLNPGNEGPVPTSWLIADNEIYNNSNEGIAVYNGGALVIRNNILDRNAASGGRASLLIQGGTYNVIDHNVIRNTGTNDVGTLFNGTPALLIADGGGPTLGASATVGATTLFLNANSTLPLDAVLNINGTNYTVTAAVNNTTTVDITPGLVAAVASNTQLQYASVSNIITDNVCETTAGVTTQNYGIQEVDTADYNIYSGNRLGPSNTAAMQLVGVHDVAINNPGFNPVGWVTAPALPTTVGSGGTVTNTYPYAVRVYLTGASGVTLVDQQGTAQALPYTPSELTLDVREAVYFTTTVPSAWVWYGL